MRSATLTLLLVVGVAGIAAAQPVPLFGPQTFERTGGEADLYAESFEAEADGWFLVFVRNGDGETSRVRSATILLNGTQIVGSDELDAETAGLIRRAPVSAGQNTLTVEITGEPGSVLTVAVGRPDRAPLFAHGRLLLPWGSTEGERQLTLALKNGSPHHPRAFRLVFFSPEGQVMAATERLALPPRASRLLPVDELHDGSWSGGSIEIFYAGPGTGRLFGSARQTDTVLGLSDVQPLASAGFHVFRGPGPDRGESDSDAGNAANTSNN